MFSGYYSLLKPLFWQREQKQDTLPYDNDTTSTEASFVGNVRSPVTMKKMESADFKRCIKCAGLRKAVRRVCEKTTGTLCLPVTAPWKMYPSDDCNIGATFNEKALDRHKEGEWANNGKRRGPQNEAGPSSESIRIETGRFSLLYPWRCTSCKGVHCLAPAEDRIIRDMIRNRNIEIRSGTNVNSDSRNKFATVKGIESISIVVA